MVACMENIKKVCFPDNRTQSLYEKIKRVIHDHCKHDPIDYFQVVSVLDFVKHDMQHLSIDNQ